ncbi:MAG: TerC family protein [Micrococcales bacterium]
MSEGAYIWFEVVSMVAITGILIADLLVIFKRPHIPSAKESAIWISAYAVLALVFAGILWQFVSPAKSSEFLAGWLTEYSLSVDNLFVFVLIMSRFSVPKKYQQEVLMVGVIMALTLRGVFIVIGSALIEQFSAIFYLFGAFLLYTAFHQAFRSEGDDEETESRLIIWLRKRISVSEGYDGAKLRTEVNGRKVFTPMIVVFLAIALTDVMFAFDSIPAIFGITTDSFIVFTANVFALMGLRQLYFLLGGLLDKLEYLKYGISFILAFIGFKLVAHALHVNELPFVNGGKAVEWAPEISSNTSLLVIVASIAVSAVASLTKARLKRS